MSSLQIVIIIFVVSIFESCTSTAHVDGTYTNIFAEVAGEEFRFTQEPKTFEYYSRTEGVLKGYSSGFWTHSKATIHLYGFDDENINTLNVESKVENSPNENRNKIIIQYKDDPLDTFIKVDILANRNSSVRISGDTSYFNDTAIRTLQIKSYLVHEGFLLGYPHLIDTLYSPEIEVINPGEHNMVVIKFEVAKNAFYRAKLTDTLIVKNNRTLIWRHREFKKIRE